MSHLSGRKTIARSGLYEYNDTWLLDLNMIPFERHACEPPSSRYCRAPLLDWHQEKKKKKRTFQTQLQPSASSIHHIYRPSVPLWRVCLPQVKPYLLSPVRRFLTCRSRSSTSCSYQASRCWIPRSNASLRLSPRRRLTSFVAWRLRLSAEAFLPLRWYDLEPLAFLGVLRQSPMAVECSSLMGSGSMCSGAVYVGFNGRDDWATHSGSRKEDI